MNESTERRTKDTNSLFFFLLETIGKGQYQNNVAGLSTVSSCLLFQYELVR